MDSKTNFMVIPGLIVSNLSGAYTVRLTNRALTTPNGTDPTDTNSFLRIVQTIAPGAAGVNFGAVSNRTYTVQYPDLLPATSWQKLADIVSRPTNRVELLADPAWMPKRFYRVVTPRQP